MRKLWRPPARDTFVAAALALLALALYARTAAPSVATLFDDSLEFQVVLPTLGIAHPSGYPLYTLLGKLATLLIPFRDAAGRLNLLSALCAAIAVGLLYRVAVQLAGNRAAALTATIVFAISAAWWSQATIAEVYALHGLLFILAIYCLLRWEEERGEGTGVRGQDSACPACGTQARAVSGQRSVPGTPRPMSGAGLTATALIFGLGLAHHRMIALLLPAALVFVVWTAFHAPGGLAAVSGRPSAAPRLAPLVRLLVCVLAPLLLYLYLPLRGAQGVTSLDGTYVPTLAGTLAWITARGYSIFLTGNPFGVSRDAAFFIGLFLGQIGALLGLATVWGLATGWRYGLRRYVFLIVATLAQVAFGVAYKVEDVAVFFIPAFMLAALWSAIGLAPIFDAAAVRVSGLARGLRVPRWTRPAVLGVTSLAVAVVFLFEPMGTALRDLPGRDRSDDWAVYDYGEDLLANVAPDGRVVGLLGETTLLRYFRDVLGRRTDLSVVPADSEASRFAAVDAALAAGVPVYLTRDLPGAAQRYSLDAAGPLIAVAAKSGPALPPSGQAVGAGILLVDARVAVRRTHAGPVVRLTLAWAATAPVPEALKVSARLLDAAGKIVAQDDRVPVHFAYPTTAWVPGEVVADVYDLSLPQGAHHGSYDVLLILYRAADGSEVGRIALPPLALSP